MSLVAAKLSDGLGNRLFQLAAALGYSDKYKKRAIFLLPVCKPTNHGKFNTIFKLFPHIEIVYTANYWDVINEGSNYYRYTDLPDKEDLVVIHGYRQSWKYFSNISIQPDFEACINNTRLEDLYKTYLNHKKIWSIHVRNGDFNRLPHHYMNKNKYYMQAIRDVPKDVHILLISDEPNKCGFIEEQLQELSFKYTVCYETDEIETLYLMSMCLNGSVVSNSTFAWWGAYLAHNNSLIQNIEHIGYYPSILGRGLPAPVDYVPPWGIIYDSL